MTYNQKNVTLKLTRIELCDLLIACNTCADLSNAEKWAKLHDKIDNIISEFDKENLKEEVE